jgi:hypothetical protein
MKSRTMRWTDHVARIGEMRNIYNILVGKPEGKRTLVRFTRKLETNNRKDFRETGWKYLDWLHLAQDRDQWRVFGKTVMKIRVQ